jgi:hypothetical protein
MRLSEVRFDILPIIVTNQDCMRGKWQHGSYKTSTEGGKMNEVVVSTVFSSPTVRGSRFGG